MPDKHALDTVEQRDTPGDLLPTLCGQRVRTMAEVTTDAAEVDCLECQDCITLIRTLGAVVEREQGR